MADGEKIPLPFNIAELLKRCDDLLAALNAAESHHGGLLTRETVRAGDELRIELSRLRKIMAITASP